MKKLVCIILCISALCTALLQGFGSAYAASASETTSSNEPPAVSEATTAKTSPSDEPPAVSEAVTAETSLSGAEETSGEPTTVRKTNTLKKGANFYVVGNPDCYPYEYYNAETGNYEGLLPRILGEIAAENGFSLLYFTSSDSRQGLAENSQGEIISACVDDEFSEFEHTKPIFSYVSEDGEQHTVSIAFSNAAGADLVSLMTKSVNSISSKTKLEYYYSFVQTQRNDEGKGLVVAVWILGALAAGAAVFAVIVLVKTKKKEGRALDTEFVLTADGLERFFDTNIKDVTRTLYDVTFLSCSFPSENARTDKQRRVFAGILKDALASGDVLGFMHTGFCVISNSENTDVGELVKKTEQAKLDAGLDGMDVFCGTLRLSKTDRHFADAVRKAESAADMAKDQKTSLIRYHEQTETVDDYTAQELIDALEKGEFKPVYQPVFDAASGKLRMVDVHARWESQTYGYLEEQRFKEAFRKNGLVTRLDVRIFAECCRRLKYRRQIGKSTPPAICNFSRRSLLSKDFLIRILEILKKTGCDASSFIFEIRVKDRKTDLRALADVTEKLHEIGIAVSLDTAGTGLIHYEDFSLLNVDYLKIDDSILRLIGKNEATVLILNSVTTLHEVGVKLICNNISDEHLLKQAILIDTDFIEGDYCCAQLDTAGIEKLIDSNK